MQRPDNMRVLITLHHRENWPKMNWIAAAVKRLALKHPEAQFSWPLNPNPAASRPAVLTCASQRNIDLLPALPYPDFKALLATSSLVITDSLAMQEESATLGIPSLVVGDDPDFLKVADLLLAGKTAMEELHSGDVPC